MKLVMPLLFTSFLFLLSCNPKINQTKNNQRHGKWVIVDAQGDSSIEHYRNGIERGLSKQFTGGKLYRTERIYRQRSKIRLYHPNGKISSEGWTESDDDSKILHWFYSGEWKYFNEWVKLTDIRIFERGQIVGERRIY